MSENLLHRCSSSPGSDSGTNSENKPSSGGALGEPRRGRPKAAMITNLIMEGATSQSGIRCEVCSRVFPRDKSLQAHRRIHTGERPYSCDYPGCMRKFKQSGQLKTHQRLHTGERPFKCSVDGCSSRFTHANRHCPTHSQASLVRSEDTALLDIDATISEEIREWLAKYRAEREIKNIEKKEAGTPLSKGDCFEVLTPKSEERDFNILTNSILDRELADMTNFTNPANPTQSIPVNSSPSWSPIKTPVKSSPLKTPRLITTDRNRPVKILFFSDATTTVSPRKRELPKKRWLRIASRELASYSLTSPTLSANLSRPTVLRHASGYRSGAPLASPASQIPPATAAFTPATQPLLQSLLTPPYSDEKRRYREDDEELLAIPLPPHDDAHFWQQQTIF